MAIFTAIPSLVPSMAKEIMHRLALPNDLIRDACLLIKYHDRPLKAERKSVLGMMNRFAAEGVDTPRLMDELFDLKRADALGKSASALSTCGKSRTCERCSTSYLRQVRHIA